jgi:hypothetical protein
MEAFQRVKLAGYEFVISELEVDLDHLRRATATWGSERPKSMAPIVEFAHGDRA